MGSTAALRSRFPQSYSVRGNLQDFPITFGSGFELRMTQHFSNIMCRFQNWHIQHDEAVVGMTPARAEEPYVARKERYLLGRMQEPQNLLLIVPLGASDLKADLLKVNALASKLFCLVLRDVVV